MALKGYQKYVCGDDNGDGVFADPDPTSCDYVVAEKGSLLIYSATFTGSGKAGDAGNNVGLPTAAFATELPFGLLLSDVVRVNESRFCHVGDQFRLETLVCKPVKSIRRGTFFTNWLDPAVNPASVDPGDDLYFNEDGFTNIAGSVKVGTFGGVIGADLYALIKLDIN